MKRKIMTTAKETGNCPYCGEEKVKELKKPGRAWCAACHRSWGVTDTGKIKNERRATGMVCPFCFSLRVVRNGAVRKLCKDCGKQWSPSIYQFAAESIKFGGNVDYEKVCKI